jgi:hypothetical protein
MADCPDIKNLPRVLCHVDYPDTFYEIVNGTVYRDREYYGDVVEFDGSEGSFRVVSSNPYIGGKLMYFKVLKDI